MTDFEAWSITNYLPALHTLDLVSIERQGEDYSVRIGYKGARLVYREPKDSVHPGRIHRLQPGVLTIASMEEWNELYMVITHGINAEFFGR